MSNINTVKDNLYFLYPALCDLKKKKKEAQFALGKFWSNNGSTRK